MQVTIGREIFSASLRRDLAPQSCRCLERLLPLCGELIHARWSGEACWSPLAAVWPEGLLLPRENATARPEPGELLLFAGGTSEPELLLAYGAVRFASGAGPLEGNPVLTINDRMDRLAELGREILRHGVADLRIDAQVRIS